MTMTEKNNRTGGCCLRCRRHLAAAFFLFYNHTMMPYGREEEIPCGHTMMPYGRKEEIPCGHTMMPYGRKEEIPCLRAKQKLGYRSCGQRRERSTRLLWFCGLLLCMLTPTSALADLVLPDNTGNEKIEIDAENAGQLHPQIALTFDDGPHPIYTAQLLDGLKERGIHATFFVVGENIEGNETVLKRMRQEGHLIGNHTYHHVNLEQEKLDQAVVEIGRTSSIVEQVTGQGTEFVRPPFGSWPQDLEYQVMMLPVLWDVDTLDWMTQNADVTVRKVISQAADQKIVLFHDCYAASVEAALRCADELKARGYEFVTADRLILAP